MGGNYSYYLHVENNLTFNGKLNGKPLNGKYVA